ncbi:MAG: hypothetical protein ABWY07_13370 [Burkholderiales bacterium]
MSLVSAGTISGSAGGGSAPDHRAGELFTVVVAALPEPSESVMLLASIAMISFIAHRRLRRY